MRTITLRRPRHRFVTGAAAAGLALAAVAIAACGRSGPWPETPVQALGPALAPGDSQVLVGCEPYQRTVVRQVMLEGRPVAYVSCVATGAAPAPAAYGTAPVAWSGTDARILEPAAPAVRPAVIERRVVYERAPARRVSGGRSVAKSAIIIGSSAGIGAGIGAAVGGKKGALIGAAIGGGSAAIWDQVTRR
ncbi:MAG TPA: hypothetical protein VNI83_14785 [Vicinamibacterales bacterium]|nr:hypothetical protein [Vicinamibacterales bacterium]